MKHNPPDRRHSGRGGPEPIGPDRLRPERMGPDRPPIATAAALAPEAGGSAAAIEFSVRAEEAR